MNKFIFTSAPESQQMAFNEIKACISDAKLVSYVSFGVGIVETSEPFSKVSTILRDNIIVFIRHICPINKSFSIVDKKEILDNLDIVRKLFIESAEKHSTFSVQTRIYGKNEPAYKKNFINETLSDKIMSHDFNLDVKRPAKIVSIIITDDDMFVGISKLAENLSSWSGGEYRFRNNKNVISRAEFKLLEAIDMFNINLRKYSTALDLGASPGGWTKVLLDSGLKVTCVDPADLSQPIADNKNVTHHKCSAQDFLEGDYEFDIIVNDMRMDVFESIALMERASRYLIGSSIAIMTLKLREKSVQTQVNKAIRVISTHYEVLHAKQLFHNRSEVTLVLSLNQDKASS